MESQKIKLLLEKYWEGRTSSGDERKLQQYFRGKVPEDESKYRLIFDYRDHIDHLENGKFDLAFLDATDSPVNEMNFFTSRRRIISNWGISLAASIVIAFFSISYQWPHTQTIYVQSDHMETAYNEALAALVMVADKLNKGNESILEISVFDETTKHIIDEIR